MADLENEPRPIRDLLMTVVRSLGLPETFAELLIILRIIPTFDLSR